MTHLQAVHNHRSIGVESSFKNKTELSNNCKGQLTNKLSDST